MRSITGLWRWRGNPLCRRSDRQEAWLCLCAALLIAVGAPLCGWYGAAQTRDSLLANATEQQRERRLVSAIVEDITVPTPGNQKVGSQTREFKDAPETDAGGADDAHETDTESGQRGERNRVSASWPTPEGDRRTGTVTLHHAVHPGERFHMWTDSSGRPAKRPMATHTASSHAALAGVGVTAVIAGAVEAGRRLMVRDLLRRRYARWEAEWRRIGPDWGRTGSSS